METPAVDALRTAGEVVEYAPDAYVLAEALSASVQFVITHDRQHLLGNPRAASLGCRVCSPGECLEWVRGWLGGADAGGLS